MTLLIGQQREVIVRASEQRSLQVQLGASSDPTGVTPQFKVTATTVEDPGTSGWVSGSWNGGTYGNAGGGVWTYAYTPLIGDSSTSFELTSGNRYRLWMWLPSFASESDMELCGTIRCP